MGRVFGVVLFIGLFSWGCRPLFDNKIDSTVPDINSQPTAVDDADAEEVIGLASVESVEILFLESFPVQITAVARGYLPDGCTNLGKVITEKENNSFRVMIETTRPIEAVCTQAIKDFETSIPLEVNGLAAGTYTVTINGVDKEFVLEVDNIVKE